MDDNCGEWVECMGVASGCGFLEVPYGYKISRVQYFADLKNLL